jgi:hypothetical protein
VSRSSSTRLPASSPPARSWARRCWLPTGRKANWW